MTVRSIKKQPVEKTAWTKHRKGFEHRNASNGSAKYRIKVSKCLRVSHTFVNASLLHISRPERNTPEITATWHVDSDLMLMLQIRTCGSTIRPPTCSLLNHNWTLLDCFAVYRFVLPISIVALLLWNFSCACDTLFASDAQFKRWYRNVHHKIKINTECRS